SHKAITDVPATIGPRGNALGQAMLARKERKMIKASRLAIAGSVGALVLVAAGCGGGGGGSNNAATTTSSGGGKGGTLILLANAAPSGSPDPQINYTLQEWQLLIDSHDGLVAFKRAGGVEGTKIVPDLATTVPKPTNGGKTYTFTLRKNIKFSDGTTLKPSDVKFTFERLFKVHSPNAGSCDKAIEGGDACVTNPRSAALTK